MGILPVFSKTSGKDTRPTSPIQTSDTATYQLRILESQRRYLPSAVVDAFVFAQVVGDVPSAWTDIYRRLQAKEIMPSEAIEAVQVIVRQAEKALLVRR